jgi:hypothetical protein
MMLILLLVISSYALGNVQSVTIDNNQRIKTLHINIKNDTECKKGYQIAEDHQIYVWVRTLAFTALAANKNLEILRNPQLTKEGTCKIQYISLEK